MDKPTLNADATTPDTLAKRIFVIVMLGAIAYVGAIIVLMSSMQ